MVFLTDDMLQTYQDAFCMFENHLGVIKCELLRDVLKTLGFNPTDVELENMTIMADADGNNELDFDEFVDLTRRLQSDEKETKAARDSFNAFDFMGEGYIAANDIKEALLYIMEKAPEADKLNIIKHFKLDKNRRITFAEFKDMITLKR